MKFEPRDYQPAAIEHLLDHPRCNLWADPGLGKTCISLFVIDILRMTGYKHLPALVLAPLRPARRVWTDEARKWDDLHGLRVVSITGTAAERKAALKIKADVYVINYENIEWLCEILGDNWPFGVVFADEATKLRGFRLRAGTKRARALSLICKRTARWVNLTGTPTPNGLISLWGPNWFVDGGKRLGYSFGAFKDRWFTENVYSRTITAKDNALAEISELMADVTLSIKSDAEEPIHNNILIDLPAAAREMYDKMETEMLVELAGMEVTAATAAQISMKCLQICAGALYTLGTDFHVIHDEKIEALKELHDGMNNAPLLVVYHWKHDLARLKKAFPYAKQLLKPVDEDRWNEGRYPLLLVHAQSAGHGLNLQWGGATMAFYSKWWSMEEYKQVIERIGPTRQKQAGLDRSVVIHHLMIRDSVDESVMARLTQHLTVQQALRQRLER